MKKILRDYLLIFIGSVIYSFATTLFIFPHSLLLGGTSGISVILNAFLPSFSPGTILLFVNGFLIVLAFAVLGKGMAVRTLVGSVFTTVFIRIAEMICVFDTPIIANRFVSAVVGAAVIAVASGVMFYCDSSSGGTDIIALIVRKYSSLNIGKALLVTDVLIVVVGGIVSGYAVAISSFVGLVVKTFGIDFVIAAIVKYRKTAENKSPSER